MVLFKVNAGSVLPAQQLLSFSSSAPAAPTLRKAGDGAVSPYPSGRTEAWEIKYIDLKSGRAASKCPANRRGDEGRDVMEMGPPRAT